MNLHDYQQNAQRTCAQLENIKLNLAHMVLGMHSEYNEYKDAITQKDDVNLAEELTDMMWYIANYCTFREYKLEEVKPTKTEKTLPYITAELQDVVKKYVAYDKEIDRVLEKELLSELLYRVFQSYEESGIDKEKSLENNISKLRVRYPEKFTTQDALQRNLDEERKELER